ncbi:hypothetical protein HPB48_003545 [Haemaphysalis longicornis]|uniref:Uncharacterized protein n=1 Tax=Haemaphysalis longicornis TaxID=44386 RepID=A0A9J6F6V1_HAELO|nr:hypothetical protein HPB48_003545 [Haemaphysalis longicornis]
MVAFVWASKVLGHQTVGWTILKGTMDLSSAAPVEKASHWTLQTVDEWVQSLPEFIEKYRSCSVFYKEEMGIFYSMQPEHTVTLRGASCHDGKRSKERVTRTVWDGAPNGECSSQLKQYVITTRPHNVSDNTSKSVRITCITPREVGLLAFSVERSVKKERPICIAEEKSRGIEGQSLDPEFSLTSRYVVMGKIVRASSSAAAETPSMVNEEAVARYHEVSSEGLGMFRRVKAGIMVPQDTKLRFFKPGG